MKILPDESKLPREGPEASSPQYTVALEFWYLRIFSRTHGAFHSGIRR